MNQEKNLRNGLFSPRLLVTVKSQTCWQFAHAEIQILVGKKTDKFGRHSEKVLREVPLGGILPVQAEASLYSHIGFFTDT